ncbi:protein COFACTOR ASSEMBLY OF COMPLEX C SUBUNIT B CCB3, chloroplastic isoform X1 [Typha angustifolia]|uniref:protein COFACTOR ASSEMBLY OF COMPLEX C SUBUNIT B CCB3, chloroplastic isoform X1 n=1 Tax=Typha angustifolia TaxID=59011 RepID=UPI003C2E7CF2
MALPYTLSARFNPFHLRSGLSHGSIRPIRVLDIMRSLRRSNQQQDSQKIKSCCLLGVASAFAVQSFDSFAAAAHETSSTPLIPQELHQSLPYYMQSLMIADLDPATAKTLIGFTGPFLSAFGFLFIVRIVMSWYPKLPVDKFPYIIAYAPTEPILSVTRKVIPPLGGVDVTPVVWFGLVSFLNEILVGPQGLLVLLSQQV